MPTPKETKLIHTARRALSMSDEAYRALLQRVAGVESSKNLNPLGVARLIREFERLGFKPVAGAGRARPRVPDSRVKQIGKINALLTHAGRPWSYADGVAKRMFGVDAVNWCDDGQLSKLIAALSADARRHGRGYD